MESASPALGARAAAPAHPDAGNPVARAADSGRPARLESLTSLRWFAAFGVFLSHVVLLLPIPYTSELFLLGTAGVTFFFVLSGFVLTWTHFAGDTAGRFYWRRFARIWPLLFLATVAGLLVTQLFGPPGRVTGESAGWFVATLLTVQAWLPGSFATDAIPNSVTWSLSCEAFFYLMFPLLVRPVLRLGRRGLLVVAAASVAVALGIRAWLWLAHPELTLENWFTFPKYFFVTYSPIARLPEFVLGITLAAAIRSGWRPRIGARAALATLAGYAVLVALWSYSGWWPVGLAETANRGSIIVFAVVIVAVAAADLNGRPTGLRSRPLVALGRWSYAFYLLHFLVLFAIAWLVFGQRSVFAPPAPSAGFIGWAVLGLVLSVLVSWAAYRFYEHPLEQRLRRMQKRPPAKPATDPAARRPEPVL